MRETVMLSIKNMTPIKAKLLHVGQESRVTWSICGQNPKPRVRDKQEEFKLCSAKIGSTTTIQ